MKKLLVALLVAALLVPAQARAEDNAGSVLLISGGTGFIVLGLMAFVYGEKDYNDNKNDYRVPASEAERVHKNWQTIGTVSLGIGVAGIALGSYFYNQKSNTTVSVDLHNNTPILTARHAF